MASEGAFLATWLRCEHPVLAQSHYLFALYFPNVPNFVVAVRGAIRSVFIFLGKRKKDVVMAKKQVKPKISRSKAPRWKQWSTMLLLLLLLLSMILVLNRL